jgi:hypothetical protein
MSSAKPPPQEGVGGGSLRGGWRGPKKKERRIRHSLYKFLSLLSMLSTFAPASS